MNEYIDRDALRQAVLESQHDNPHPRGMAHIIHDCEHAHFVAMIARFPAADVAPVVRCKDCKHSTLPSELTRRYGKPGTRTCHNMHAPSNRRNVGSNDFCSYGEQKDGGASNG